MNDRGFVYSIIIIILVTVTLNYTYRYYTTLKEKSRLENSLEHARGMVLKLTKERDQLLEKKKEYEQAMTVNEILKEQRDALAHELANVKMHLRLAEFTLDSANQQISLLKDRLIIVEDDGSYSPFVGTQEASASKKRKHLRYGGSLENNEIESAAAEEFKDALSELENSANRGYIMQNGSSTVGDRDPVEVLPAGKEPQQEDLSYRRDYHYFAE